MIGKYFYDKQQDWYIRVEYTSHSVDMRDGKPNLQTYVTIDSLGSYAEYIKDYFKDSLEQGHIVEITKQQFQQDTIKKKLKGVKIRKPEYRRYVKAKFRG